MVKLIKFLKFLITIAIIYLIVNVGWQFISMKVDNMRIKGEMKKFLFGEIKTDEYDIRAKAIDKLSQMGVKIQFDDIIVRKPTNHSIVVEFSYKDSVVIPVINKAYYFDQEINAKIKAE